MILPDTTCSSSASREASRAFDGSWDHRSVIGSPFRLVLALQHLVPLFLILPFNIFLFVVLLSLTTDLLPERYRCSFLPNSSFASGTLVCCFFVSNDSFAKQALVCCFTSFLLSHNLLEGMIRILMSAELHTSPTIPSSYHYFCHLFYGTVLSASTDRISKNRVMS